MSLHEGDNGGIIGVSMKKADGTVLPVSAATVKQIHIDGVAYDAEFYTDGNDGVIVYAEKSTDPFMVDGNHTRQGYVEIGTDKFHSDVEYFCVLPNDE